jgi:predicted transcriptional regulator of viral defense system
MGGTEDTLRELAAAHDGLFMVQEAVAAGIRRVLIVQLANRGRLERIAQGLYRFPSWPSSELQQYHEALLWPQTRHNLAYALVSHDSALELYNLTQLNPGVIHVTIPLGTRIVRETPIWVRFHRADVEERDRTWERGIPTVTVARAIEDIAATHGIDVVHRAVSEARERRLLREDEVARLVARFGHVVLETYHGD